MSRRRYNPAKHKGKKRNPLEIALINERNIYNSAYIDTWMNAVATVSTKLLFAQKNLETAKSRAGSLEKVEIFLHTLFPGGRMRKDNKRFSRQHTEYHEISDLRYFRRQFRIRLSKSTHCDRFRSDGWKDESAHWSSTGIREKSKFDFTFVQVSILVKLNVLLNAVRFLHFLHVANDRRHMTSDILAFVCNCCKILC